jgi:hypothetical protein
VTATVTGAWTAKEDPIAVMTGGDWRFIAPVQGWGLLDRAAGRLVIYRAQWHPAAVVVAPEGGTVIDVDARAGWRPYHRPAEDGCP